MPIVTIKATTPGPCACCGIGGAVLSCRTRGGTASLIGCGEFVASTPPRAYRRVTSSGSSTSDSWTNSSCSGPFDAGTVTCVYTGFIQYNAASGVPTTGGSTICNGTTIGTGNVCGIPADACNVTYTLSPTTATRVDTANCCAQPGGTFLKSRASSESYVSTLSDEDLESDAISRLLDGASGTWSSYTPVGNGTGGTCDPTSCCKSQYQQRTTGFSFAYGEAQFKAVMTLLDPTTNYVVTFQVFRRLQGSSDPWALFVDSPYSFTTDGSGNYTITDQDVPNFEGYETYVCCPLIYKP